MAFGDRESSLNSLQAQPLVCHTQGATSSKVLSNHLENMSKGSVENVKEYRRKVETGLWDLNPNCLTHQPYGLEQ